MTWREDLKQLGYGLRLWFLPSFFYTWGIYLTMRTVFLDKVVGWKNSEIYITEWLNQSGTVITDVAFNSLNKDKGYESLFTSSELLIPISLIMAIVFLLIAYKLTPKN